MQLEKRCQDVLAYFRPRVMPPYSPLRLLPTLNSVEDGLHFCHLAFRDYHRGDYSSYGVYLEAQGVLKASRNRLQHGHQTDSVSGDHLSDHEITFYKREPH